MKLLEKILFLLFIFSIPIQLGKHFWPQFAFVSGIRVDYLSPTLYFSDIVLILLFAVSFERLKKILFKSVSKPISILLFSVLLVGCFMAVSPLPSFLKLCKLLEFVFLGFYIANTFSFNTREKFIYIFTLGGLIQCIILFLQFVSQHSLDGFFYFLGERTIGVGSIGAAVFSLNSSLVLRPYGTFPHPNVLAFYLLFPFTYLLFSFSDSQNKIAKTIAFFFIFLGIVLTFSRIVILLALIIIIIYFYLNFKRIRKSLFFISFALILLLGIALFNRFTQSFIGDLTLRTDLIKIAFQQFFKHPLFGVGLNNFFFHEILYQKNITPTLLQPVHNVYVLWLVETGLFGAISCFIFLKKTYNKALEKLKGKDNFYIATSLLFFSALMIGIFDHYLLTLQQGQLLFSVLLGLIWINKEKKRV